MTTEECHAVDIRCLRGNGLLTPGGGFSLSWSRAGRETGSIRAVAYRDRVVLSYRHRGGPSEEWEDVEEQIPWSGRRETSGESGPGSSVPK